ncbi:MAG: AAA family ATPase, partial [Nitrospira sp.]|nr:AAA family ATPase [Nitrospira sp.]
MFCDLVGSTALSAQLDPEELREVIQAYQQACSEVISRFEGHIAQYLGDGLLVYFGYPLAHEDDAQRAVRTGLGIVEEMKKLNTGLQQHRGIQLAVRIGIHTGLVVVGEMGGGNKREQLALGETPNIAARVQGIAESDTVIISSSTYRLIQGFFVCQDQGVHSLKGIPQPMEVYRILRESGIQSRLYVAGAKGLTPFVGREQVVVILQAQWERAKAGAGQVILLCGEAGIGKSRLVQIMKEEVGKEGYTRIEYRCSPYYQNSALYPVITHLQRVFQFNSEDSPQDKWNKMGETLVKAGLVGATGRSPLPEVIPLFALLLSIPL